MTKKRASKAVVLENDEAAYLLMMFRESVIWGGPKALKITDGLIGKLEAAYKAGTIAMPELIAKQFQV